jgi:hypothetical protein
MTEEWSIWAFEPSWDCASDVAMNVQFLAKEGGYTTRTLADESGISERSLHYIFRMQKSPSLTTLVFLSKRWGSVLMNSYFRTRSFRPSETLGEPAPRLLSS